jgi:hypothetical protein
MRAGTRRAFLHSASNTGTPPVTPPPTGNLNYVGPLIQKEDFENGIYDKSHFWTINGGRGTQSGISWNGNVSWPDTNGQNAVVISCRKNASSPYNGKEGGYLNFTGANHNAYRRGAVWVWEQQLPPASSFGYGFVPLLWPVRLVNGNWQDAPWPQYGEIDFPETFSSNATKQSAGDLFIHYSNGGSTDVQAHPGNLGANLTLRHKCAIAWNPGSDSAGTGCFIRAYLNDQLRFTVTNPTNVPHGTWATQMRLALQTEGYGVSAASTVNGTLEWRVFNVAVYNLP